MKLSDLCEDENIDRALSGDAPVSDDDIFVELCGLCGGWVPKSDWGQSGQSPFCAVCHKLVCGACRNLKWVHINRRTDASGYTRLASSKPVKQYVCNGCLDRAIEKGIEIIKDASE